jgi:hypothetical protein
MTSHENLSDGNLAGMLQQKKWKFNAPIIVPVTGYQILVDHPSTMFLNPAGAVNVQLPLETGNQGLGFLLFNLSANAITLVNSAGNAFTVPLALAANQAGLFMCTGLAALTGWRAFVAAGTQTSP